MKSGEEAVAGRGVPRHDDVAALLAAEDEPASSHRLEHVAVADTGLNDGDLSSLHRLLEAEVCHDGRDHSAIDQGTGRIHRAGKDGQNVVTVDKVAIGINSKAAVCITVVRDTSVGAIRNHGRDEIIHVSAAAPVIDVQAIRRGMNGDDGGARRGVDLLCEV